MKMEILSRKVRLFSVYIWTTFHWWIMGVKIKDLYSCNACCILLSALPLPDILHPRHYKESQPASPLISLFPLTSPFSSLLGPKSSLGVPLPSPFPAPRQPVKPIPTVSRGMGPGFPFPLEPLLSSHRAAAWNI